MEYKDYNDNELVSFISEGNEDANNILIKKYEPLIIKIANKMLPYCKGSGIELNDLIQEGMIGLNHAIDRYIEIKDITFFTYARTCIQRKILSVVVCSNRNKNKPLNQAISLDDEENMLLKILKDNKNNPEESLLDDENIKNIYDKIKLVLSEFEYKVFEMLVSGFKYKEIADNLNKDIKSIDNTIQRLKIKIKKILEAE